MIPSSFSVRFFTRSELFLLSAFLRNSARFGRLSISHHAMRILSNSEYGSSIFSIKS